MITDYLKDTFTDFNYTNKYYFNYPTTQPVVKNTITQNNETYTLPETAINNTIDFTYSYDEEITFKQNYQRELKFKMLKYIQINSQMVLNPYAAALSVGSLIRLYDRYHILHDFIITKLSYTFKNANVEISYECQDMFSYKHIRQNSGYSINQDETSADFVGAKKIDEWAEKIVVDCFITYKYLRLTDTIYAYRNENDNRIITTNIEEIPANISYTILREPLATENEDLNDPTIFNAYITFELNNSNALNALYSLAEQRGLNLYIDDENQIFYFIPEKNEEFSGFYYTPQLNITSFTPSQQGQSLTTVLNVTGQTLNNSEITMLPTVPPFFLNLFSSKEWQQTKYEPNYFHYLITSKTSQLYLTTPRENQLNWQLDDIENPTEYTISYSTEIPIGQYEYVTWDNAFLIYFNNDTAKNPTELDLLSWEWIIGTDSYLYKNEGQHSSDPAIDPTCTQYYYNTSQDQWYKSEGNNPWEAINDWKELINKQIEKDDVLKPITLNITTEYTGLTILAINAAILFQRKWTKEEEDFAKMADKLPWLENKIIDVEFFRNNGFISKTDFKILQQLLYNDLRRINGSLIYYNHLYYNSFLQRLEYLSKLNAAIDTFCADQQRYIKGDVTESTISVLYASLYSTPGFCLIDLPSIIEDKANTYFQIEQNFFKNLYKFQQEWEKKVYFDVYDDSAHNLVDDNNCRDWTVGHFYEIYKTIQSSETILLTQQAALLGTQLQEYWGAAYSAGLQSQWYLPESFDDFTYFEASQQTVYNSNYQLQYIYMPQIDIYEYNNEREFYQGRIRYLSTNDSLHNYIIEDSDTDPLKEALLNIVTDNSGTDHILEFKWEPYTTINKVNYYKCIPNTGKQYWSNDIKPARLNNPFGGIYPLQINLLLSNYSNFLITQRDKLLAEQKLVWQTLYEDFGNYLLENSYKDELATTSEDLYNAAMNFFKDQSAPEKSYDISVIDITNLKGYQGQQINVTDQIRLGSIDFYKDLDELKNILDQPLFVTSVSYKLRSDTDIKLTVSTIKYQDKMIQRLVKLIK